MKKCLFSLGFFLLFITPSVGFAQHWLWVHDTSSVIESGAAQNVATDRFGNVYCAADNALFKHDAATGNIKWQIPSGGAWSQTSVITDPAGNVYLYLLGYLAGSWSFIIKKIDSSGTLIWSRTGVQLGATGQVLAWAIASDNFGHVYITGCYTSDGIAAGTDTLLNVHPNRRNSFIIKYDSSGNINWAKSITSPGSGGSFYGQTTAYGLSTDPSGNFYIVGTDYSDTLTLGDTTVHLHSPVRNIFVAKCDSNCHVLWITSNTKLSPGIYDRRVYQIGSDGAGNTYIAGYYSEDDTLGNIPIHYTPTAWGMAFVAKYESTTGNVIWAKTGGAGVSIDQYIYSFATNLSGNSYLLFPSYPSSSFGDSVFISTSDSSAPITIVELDSSGNVQCGCVLGGFTGDDLCGIGIDNTGYAYVCGDFRDSCKFGDSVIHGSIIEEYFVAKFACSVGTEDPLQIHPNLKQVCFLTLYPNPANTTLNITSSNIITDIVITNLLGQTVFVYLFNTEKVQINVADLPTGVYIIRINGSAVRKFVKE